MSERNIKPELRKLVRDAVDGAFTKSVAKGERTATGLRAAAEALEPIIAGVDANAHGRGRREAANEVEAIIGGGGFLCHLEGCTCAGHRLALWIEANAGRIAP